MERINYTVELPKILVDMLERADEATINGFKTWRKIHGLERSMNNGKD